jgi:GAF domain-containing protein
VRNGQVEVAQAALVGEQSVATLAQRVLDRCVQYTGAAVGAFYVVHEDGSVRRAAGHALPSGAEGSELLARGEGLTGQALNSREIVQLDRLPPSYLQVGSTLGATAPVDVLIVPAYAGGSVYALMELAFLRRAEPRIRELMEQVADPIAVAVRTALLARSAGRSAAQNSATVRRAAGAAGTIGIVQRRAGTAEPHLAGVAGAPRDAAGRARADQ